MEGTKEGCGAGFGFEPGAEERERAERDSLKRASKHVGNWEMGKDGRDD